MAKALQQTSLRRVAGRATLAARVLLALENGAAYKIGDLAGQLRVSPSHLQRAFKRETGLRIGEWLIAQRLEKSAYLLANSYLSVKEIARAVGYEHLSSFTRAFEHRYVVAPTRYRETTDKDRSGSSGAAA